MSTKPTKNIFVSYSKADEARIREFLELMAATGWNQSETAERLHKTSNYVNMIVNGKAKVTDSILKLLKMVIASERPDILSKQGDAFVLIECKSVQPLAGEQVSPTISEQNRLAGVKHSRGPSSGRKEITTEGSPVKYPGKEEVGMVAYHNPIIEQATRDLEQIAEEDPAKAREIASIISTYKKTIRQKKKKPTK